MAGIVFHHDDTIIHEDSQREYECKEGDTIYIETEDKSDDKYDTQYERNTKRRIESVTPPEKDHEHECHDGDTHE